MWSKLSKVAAVVAAGLVLAACSRSIESDVVSFHRLPEAAGETFTITAKDPAKKGSLELEAYAGQIRARLVDLGYQPVVDGADLEVRVDYGISDGRERIRTRPGVGPAGFYSFYGFRYGFPIGDPFFGGPAGGWQNDVYSYAIYTRRLEMDIVKADGGEMLFEGRAISEGKDSRLPEVMPYLVQAMFTNFPGESGVTKVVSIEIPDSNKRY